MGLECAWVCVERCRGDERQGAVEKRERRAGCAVAPATSDPDPAHVYGSVASVVEATSDAAIQARVRACPRPRSVLVPRADRRARLGIGSASPGRRRLQS